jgi:hypothetical protein
MGLFQFAALATVKTACKNVVIVTALLNRVLVFEVADAAKTGQRPTPVL